jgi:hypothetical protein
MSGVLVDFHCPFGILADFSLVGGGIFMRFAAGRGLTIRADLYRLVDDIIGDNSFLVLLGIPQVRVYARAVVFVGKNRKGSMEKNSSESAGMA